MCWEQGLRDSIQWGSNLDAERDAMPHLYLWPWTITVRVDFSERGTPNARELLPYAWELLPYGSILGSGGLQMLGNYYRTLGNYYRTAQFQVAGDSKSSGTITVRLGTITVRLDFR